jgi:four helix bundle protein
MRRAAVSIPSNVAEGQATGKKGRYLNHVMTALGSLGELATQVEIAKRLQLLAPETARRVEDELGRTGQLLHGLARSIKEKQAVQAGAWLTLLAGLGFGKLVLPRFGEFSFVSSGDNLLTLPLAPFHFVLPGVHIDVLAHLISSVFS